VGRLLHPHHLRVWKKTKRSTTATYANGNHQGHQGVAQPNEQRRGGGQSHESDKACEKQAS